MNFLKRAADCVQLANQLINRTQLTARRDPGSARQDMSFYILSIITITLPTKLRILRFLLIRDFLSTKVGTHF